MAEHTVRSPLPWVFYRRPAPGQPAFVEVGADVTADQTVGLVEVMKSFNEVRATVSGKLLKFLTENEDAVMAGQPLAEIE